MAKQYYTRTKTTPARPRSKRLRETTSTATTGGGASSVIIQGIGGTSSGGDGHTHANKSDLDRISLADGYEYVTTTIVETDSRGVVTATTTTEKVKAGHADEADTAAHADEADTAAWALEADTAAHADEAAEADHAVKAYDLDDNSPVRGEFLSKVHDDTAAGTIRHKAAVQSETFTTGFDGEGWTIQPATPEEHGGGASYLEVDNLRVRGTMTAHELVIERVRAICGSLGISQACGRVERAYTTALYYVLVMEGDATHGYGGFKTGDFIRCQRVTKSGVRGYWVRIHHTNGAEKIYIARTEFEGVGIALQGAASAADHVAANATYLVTMDGATTLTKDDDSTLLLSTAKDPSAEGELMVYPAAGDEIIQYGNATDTARQSAVFIHADEDGKPAVDILQGISDRTFVGCLSVRLGAGLPDTAGLPTSSVGLYTKNGHIVSTAADGTTQYELKPDGTFTLARGGVTYDGTSLNIEGNIRTDLARYSAVYLSDSERKTDGALIIGAGDYNLPRLDVYETRSIRVVGLDGSDPTAGYGLDTDKVMRIFTQKNSYGEDPVLLYVNSENKITQYPVTSLFLLPIGTMGELIGVGWGGEVNTWIYTGKCYDTESSINENYNNNDNY